VSQILKQRISGRNMHVTSHARDNIISPFEVGAPTRLTVGKRTHNPIASESSPLSTTEWLSTETRKRKRSWGTGMPSSSYKLDGPYKLLITRKGAAEEHFCTSCRVAGVLYTSISSKLVSQRPCFKAPFLQAH
jgi:hypothetical protein